MDANYFDQDFTCEEATLMPVENCITKQIHQDEFKGVSVFADEAAAICHTNMQR